MSVKKMFCVFLLDLRSTETLVLFQKHIIHKVSVWLLLRGPKNQEEKMFTKICLNLGLYVYIHKYSHYIHGYVQTVTCAPTETH